MREEKEYEKRYSEKDKKHEEGDSEKDKKHEEGDSEKDEKSMKKGIRRKTRYGEE